MFKGLSFAAVYHDFTPVRGTCGGPRLAINCFQTSTPPPNDLFLPLILYSYSCTSVLSIVFRLFSKTGGASRPPDSGSSAGPQCQSKCLGGACLGGASFHRSIVRHATPSPLPATSRSVPHPWPGHPPAQAISEEADTEWGQWMVLHV